MIVDDTNKIYQCDDFSMEKEIIFFVKTILIKYPYLFSVIFFIILIICQQIKIWWVVAKIKKLKIFRFSKALTGYSRLLKRLEIPNNNSQFYYKRKLDNMQDTQETLKLFEQVSFKKNNNDFCYRYKSEEILKINDLNLIINPKNKHFFEIICFSQKITCLINNEFDLMNCYFINFKNSFSLKIELV